MRSPDLRGDRKPVSGNRGYYRIFSYAYYPSIGFAVNCIILISNAASLAGVALIGAEYIVQVLFPGRHDTSHIQVIIAISSIILFYGINLLGLKMSARTQNLLTMIKIGMILLWSPRSFLSLILRLPWKPSGRPIRPWKNTSVHSVSDWWRYLFTYGGYQQTINFGEEVSNPSKKHTQGIFLGILIIILLYLTINYAYFKVIGFLCNWKHPAALHPDGFCMFWGIGGQAPLGFLFLSVLAYVNVFTDEQSTGHAGHERGGRLAQSIQQENPRPWRIAYLTQCVCGTLRPDRILGQDLWWNTQLYHLPGQFRHESFPPPRFSSSEKKKQATRRHRNLHDETLSTDADPVHPVFTALWPSVSLSTNQTPGWRDLVFWVDLFSHTSWSGK